MAFESSRVINMSAHTSQSQSVAIDNSEGSTNASRELVKGFGISFGDIQGTDLGDLTRRRLDKIEQEAFHRDFDNVRFHADGRVTWTCDLEQAITIQAACCCSGAAYDDDEDLRAECENLGLVPVSSKSGSVTGVRRAVYIWKLKPDMLFIAIRGSSKLLDHTLDLNASIADASDFLRVSGDMPRTGAHAGFLGAAKALAAYVRDQINEQVNHDPSIKHIVFTGHSSGGSISSLLFLHFAAESSQTELFARCKMSIYTFGSPPAIERNSLMLDTLSRVKTALAFVNEYDPVPRAEQGYIRSLVDLYRLSYNRLPEEALEVSTTKADNGKLVWVLPTPRLWPVGDIILLKKSARYHLSAEDLARLLYCDVTCNAYESYTERLEDLGSGCNINTSF